MLENIYKLETGESVYTDKSPYGHTYKYVKWLEKRSEQSMMKPMIRTIKRMFEHSFEKQWYETYWGFDLHGTILVPNHTKGNLDTEFYPYAKECLQLFTKRKDIKMFTWSSSHPEELKSYINHMKEHDINFDFIQENPEISSDKGFFGYYKQKPYFNVMFEDKSGFFPEEWKDIYEMMLKYEEENYLPNPEWNIKY